MKEVCGDCKFYYNKSFPASCTYFGSKVLSKKEWCPAFYPLRGYGMPQETAASK
jgi:hypothetical protein